MRSELAGTVDPTYIRRYAEGDASEAGRPWKKCELKQTSPIAGWSRDDAVYLVASGSPEATEPRGISRLQRVCYRVVFDEVAQVPNTRPRVESTNDLRSCFWSDVDSLMRSRGLARAVSSGSVFKAAKCKICT